MDRDDLDLPQPLRDDLSDLYGANVRVPSDVDGLITNRARAHFARTAAEAQALRPGRLQHGTRWIRWTGAAAAVAAVLVVSIMLVQRSEPQQQVAVAGDTNRDGVVDIRDALALARKIEAGTVDVSAREDVNNDRSVDRKDVDAIAMMSVKLDAEAVQ